MSIQQNSQVGAIAWAMTTVWPSQSKSHYQTQRWALERYTPVFTTDDRLGSTEGLYLGKRIGSGEDYAFPKVGDKVVGSILQLWGMRKYQVIHLGLSLAARQAESWSATRHHSDLII